jgi:hypothetical protein
MKKTLSSVAPPDRGVMTLRPSGAARRRNMARFAGLHARRALARGLLLLAAMSGVVAHSACIIPVPLDLERQEANRAPQILVDDASPRFGRFSPPTDPPAARAFEFKIVVEDLDLARLDAQDQLSARLLREVQVGSELVLIAESALTPSGDDPLHVQVTFGPQDYCGLFTNPQSTVITVVVSDRGFPSFVPGTGVDPMLPTAGGATDFRQWTLACAQ